MYTGTLIDELLDTVERTEQRTVRASSTEEKLTYFYNLAEIELRQFTSGLAGVA
jgi:hypothetical protein